jgi:short-subunit dehydrogenase
MNKKTVLITGASSGLGYEFAKLFAKNGYDLVLIARDKKRLSEVGNEISNQYHSEVIVIDKDLSNPQAAEEIYQFLHQKNIVIDILINNAGFATHGKFIELSLENEVAEMNLNMVTLTILTKLFLTDMVKRDSGKILNVASTAAYFPGPFMAVYYASKSYVLLFSEGLSEELKGTGVTISTLCPGPTKTNFSQRANVKNTLLFKGNVMNAEDVVTIGFAGLIKGKRVIIPGFLNNLQATLAPFTPRTLLLKIAATFNR